MCMMTQQEKYIPFLRNPISKLCGSFFILIKCYVFHTITHTTEYKV